MPRQGTEAILFPDFMARLAAADIDAVEVFDTDYAATDFMSLINDKRVYTEGKGWVNSIPVIPAQVLDQFDKMIMSFGTPTLDSVTALTLTLYALDQNSSPRRLGETVLNASAELPPIVFARTREPLFLAVTKITTSGNGLTTALPVYIQGSYNSEYSGAVVSY